MNDSLAKHVRAAAVAGWWTILIAAVWLTLAWVLWLIILATKPDWLLTLWGGGEHLTWATVQTMVLWFFGAFKCVMFVGLWLTIWLSFWSRGLKRA